MKKNFLGASVFLLLTIVSPIFTYAQYGGGSTGYAPGFYAPGFGPKTTTGQVLGTSTFAFRNSDNLVFGKRNNDVKELQDRLAKEGYYDANTISTGYFGAITRKAILAYQKAHKLPLTGIIDSATLAQLNLGQNTTDTTISTARKIKIEAIRKSLILLRAQVSALLN